MKKTQIDEPEYQQESIELVEYVMTLDVFGKEAMGKLKRLRRILLKEDIATSSIDKKGDEYELPHDRLHVLLPKGIDAFVMSKSDWDKQFLKEVGKIG